MFHFLFMLVNLGLIVGRLIAYRHAVNVDGSTNWAIMVARAAGEKRREAKLAESKKNFIFQSKLGRRLSMPHVLKV